MTVVLMYLPFLQVQMARENRFASIFDVPIDTTRFQASPMGFLSSVFLNLAVALRLYLFRNRIAPSRVGLDPLLVLCALTLLPACWLVGHCNAVIETSRSESGSRDGPHGTLQLASVPFYVLFLYLAMLTSWDGAIDLLHSACVFGPGNLFRERSGEPEQSE